MAFTRQSIGFLEDEQRSVPLGGGGSGRRWIFEQRRLNIIVKKTRQTLEVLLNGAAAEILETRQGASTVLRFNLARGDRFHDVKLGLKSAVKRAWLSGITQHTLRHSFASRSRATGRTSWP